MACVNQLLPRTHGTMVHSNPAEPRGTGAESTPVCKHVAAAAPATCDWQTDPNTAHVQL